MSIQGTSMKINGLNLNVLVEGPASLYYSCTVSRIPTTCGEA